MTSLNLGVFKVYKNVIYFFNLQSYIISMIDSFKTAYRQLAKLMVQEVKFFLNF